MDEVLGVQRLYRDRYPGWNVKHFYSFYRRRHSGGRSYSWVKNTLQQEGLVRKAAGRGKHRKRRQRAPMVGMMLHQDGSTHPWVAGQYWDLIVTLDDATTEHYSMFFVEQEGTASSFLAVKEVIERKGLFCSLYTDRGSHYWHTAEASGKVDKTHLTPDNCVGFEGKKLQIPADRYRMHYVKVTVRVHRYPDGRLAVFHGPENRLTMTAKGI